MENDFAKPGSNEDAAPHPESQHQEPIACLECGALLPRVERATDAPETAGAARIACPRCGRINDVAEAEAADRHRQQPRASP